MRYGFLYCPVILYMLKKTNNNSMRSTVLIMIGISFVLIYFILSLSSSASHKISYVNKASSTSATITNLTFYDDFENSKYSLGQDETSPNKKWYNDYSGYGVTGVAKDPTTGNHYFYEEPKISTLPNETHASLVTTTTTTKKYSNFDMTLDMSTLKQLRQNSRPNAWETAWVFWHYTDDFHTYAFYLKPTGFQIEKKDNSNRDDSAQIYLLDGDTPKLKMGQWAKVRISMVGTHIRVWVNGTNIADFYDKIPNSPRMSSGVMGLYNEDSSVRFDNVYITPMG
jgi:hypothetical protein